MPLVWNMNTLEAISRTWETTTSDGKKISTLLRVTVESSPLLEEGVIEIIADHAYAFMNEVDKVLGK